MPLWIYVLWAVNALVGVATWRNATLAVVQLVGALTKDPDRAARCAEILRLARKDAKELTSYLPSPPALTDPAPAQSPRRKRPARRSDQPQEDSMDRIAS